MQFSKPNFQKSIKNQKSIYSYNVYQINHEKRKDFNQLYNFKSNSSHTLTKESTYTKYNESGDKEKTKLSEECSTQTSKTILEIARSISPDSLAASPRQYSSVNTNRTVDDSDEDDVQFHYNSYKTDNKNSCDTISEEIIKNFNINDIDSCDSLINSDKNCYLNHSKNTLTETFLNKTRCRNSNTKYLESNRPSCLNSKKSPGDELNAIKSLDNNKFFIDRHNPPNYLFSSKYLPSFTQTNINITEKSEEADMAIYQSKQLNHPSCFKNFSHLKTPNNSIKSASKFWCPSPRNTSYLLSTAASENRNQLPQIQRIKKLISPTKRGRSLSPKIYCLEKMKTPRKVPYIDQSETNFSSDTSLMRSLSNGILHPLDKSCQTKSESSSLGQDGIFNNSNSSNSMMLTEISKLRDSDWNKSLRGLAAIVELCRINDTDMIFPYMRTVNQKLIELLKSPRSYVCRTACKAAGHLFEYIKDTRRPEFDCIVDLLLVKTADSNKFIRHDANLALDCMVTHIPSNHAIRVLCSKGPFHKNSLVRAATARLMICTIVIIGPNIILHSSNNELTRKRIFVNMANFLEDKSLETRCVSNEKWRQYGERLYKVLQKESIFETYFKKYVGKDQMARIMKILSYSQKR